MKKLFLFFLLANLAFTLSSEDFQDLYNYISASTAYIRHEVFLDSAQCKDIGLLKRLEIVLKKKIAGHWAPLMTGTGFFLDGDGTLITNRHVAQVDHLEKLRQDMANYIGQEIERTAADNFTALELRTIKVDLYTMFTKGTYRLSATVGERVYDELKPILIADGTGPDLALLRVKGDKINGLRLAESKEITVGKDVLSFGFPLGFRMEENFEKQVVTMNKGAISALRVGEWGIQHTAAISHGNSGGPLVDKNGQVLGINTAMMQDGNSLYYAISATQIHDFLERKNQGPLLLSNSNLPFWTKAADLSDIKTNSVGEIEVSSDVLISTEKGAEVFLNGKSVGQAPAVFTVSAPLSSLEVRSAKGIFKGKLRLLTSLQGMTTLTLPLLPKQTPVALETTPSGAIVKVSKKIVGTTPLETELPPGSHEVEFEMSGYYFVPITIKVEDKKPLIRKIEGLRTYPVHLDSIPSGATLIFQSKSLVLKFDSHAIPEIPTGDWTLILENADPFAGVKIPVRVATEDCFVDLNAFALKGSLRIANLEGEPRLWIDNSEISLPFANPFELPVGSHSVFIWKDGLAPLERTYVNIAKDQTSLVTWNQGTGHDSMGRLSGWAALGVAGLGIYTTAIGISKYPGQPSSPSNASALSESNSFVMAGLGTLAVAALIEWYSLSEWDRYETQKRYLKSLEAHDQN